MEEKVPAKKQKPFMVDCMSCGDAIDITGRKPGEKISCPGCNAEFVVSVVEGHLDIEFLA